MTNYKIDEYYRADRQYDLALVAPSYSTPFNIRPSSYIPVPTCSVILVSLSNDHLLKKNITSRFIPESKLQITRYSDQLPACLL